MIRYNEKVDFIDFEWMMDLKDVVIAQLKEGTYDFEANKTLLKLYLLFPHLVNQEKVVVVSRHQSIIKMHAIVSCMHHLLPCHVAQMLLKALLNLPATDFTLLLYILPEKLHTDVRP